MSAEATTTETRSSIPVVDFGGFSSDDTVRRTTAAAPFREALEAVGFCYLRGHGVPAAVLEAIFAQSREFFALPLNQKNAIRPSEVGNTIGYGGLAGQALEKGRPGDLKEIFQAADERNGPGRNRWPEQLPAFRDAVLAFQAAALQTGAALMRAIALSLELPEGYFEQFYDRAETTVRLLHYPPLQDPPPPGQIRAGAHTDFGGLSLLFPGESGLEIQLPDGAWTGAPALPGAAIVNTGDLLERWSNGQFRSTLHRVVNPTGSYAQQDRYSVVLFYNPNSDAVITCLPPCQSAERPPRFPPITAGEHILAKVRASRGLPY
jgi:isopenicillin N synthase-like dioxygenase